MKANEVLMFIAYRLRTPLQPMGDRLDAVLAVKRMIVKEAVEAERRGDTWEVPDFVNILSEAFQRELAIAAAPSA